MKNSQIEREGCIRFSEDHKKALNLSKSKSVMIVPLPRNRFAFEVYNIPSSTGIQKSGTFNVFFKANHACIATKAFFDILGFDYENRKYELSINVETKTISVVSKSFR